MPERRRAPAWLIPVVGYGVAFGCLVWVYRGFDWKTELPRLAAADWRWVALAVATDIAVYVCQGFRWSVLLRPLKPVSAWRSIQAIYIGLFANEVLPLRSGEVIRCYLQGRWNGLSFAAVLPSIVLERILDGVWLLAGFFAASRFVELPGLLVQGARALGFVIVVAAAVMAVAAARHRDGTGPEPAGRRERFFRSLIESLRALGRPSSLAGGAVLSLLYLGLQVAPVYALMRALDMDLSVWAAAVVLVVLRLGSVPPQAPSNVGAFQFFAVLGLQLLDVAKPDAVRFATLLFFVVTVPLWLAGFVALLATRMRLSEIRREAAQAGQQSSL